MDPAISAGPGRGPSHRPPALQVICILLFTFVLSKLLRWFKAYRDLVKQMPAPPQDNWILGHARSASDPKSHTIMTEFATKYGPIYYVRILHFHGVVISDPVLMHAIHDRASYPHMIDRPPLMTTFNELNSPTHDNNLLSAPTTDPLWKLVRRGVAPAFNAANIRQGFHHVVDVAQRLVQTLKKFGPDRAVNIDEAMERQAMDVIGLVGFGKDFNVTSGLQQEGGDSLFENLSRAAVEVTLRMLDPTRKYQFWRKDVQEGSQSFRKHHRMIGQLVDEVKGRGPPQEGDVTIAAHLLRIRDRWGQPLTHGRLQAEFSTMFGAGTDTTGHTLAWTLYLLSQNPKAEARVVAELGAAGLLVTKECPKPRALEYADLTKLPYLSAVIKESMRIYTVVGQGPPRVAVRDIQVGKYFIPAGTLMWPALHALHNTAANWVDPEKFMPERFLESGTDEGADGEDDKEVAGGPKRFLPFGDGVRNCAGQSLAKMNLIATLALLLSSFSFRLADRMGGPDGVSAKEVFKLAVTVEGGLWMHCCPRPLDA